MHWIKLLLLHLIDQAACETVDGKCYKGVCVLKHIKSYCKQPQPQKCMKGEPCVCEETAIKPLKTISKEDKQKQREALKQRNANRKEIHQKRMEEIKAKRAH